MKRNIACQCGQLRATVTGEPLLVNLCHCSFCRRRSGAPFGHNVYFVRSQVDVEGDSRSFERDGKEGRKVRSHFCPTCGTTLYWDLDLRLDVYGIAGGVFDDPAFAPPDYSVWEESRRTWLPMPDGLERWAGSRGS